MQKHWFLILLLFIAFSCTTENFSKQKYVKTISIKFVDLDVETIIDVKCSDFETAFSNINQRIIKDSLEMNKILSLLQKLKKADSTYYQHVDTRIKMEMKYNNDSTEIICMDRFKVYRNNNLFVNTDSLTNLLTQFMH